MSSKNIVSTVGIDPQVKLEADSLAARGQVDGLTLLHATQAVKVADEVHNGEIGNAVRLARTWAYVDVILSHVTESERFLRRAESVTTEFEELVDWGIQPPALVEEAGA